MKRSSLCLFLILSLGLVFPVMAQLPPLIDREIFFGDPEISGAQISPNGKYITFMKPLNNVRNIWIKARGESFDQARPLTADSTRPVPGYFWSQDSRYVLFVQDKGGDENYRVYAVDPTVPGTPVPSALDLTPLEKVRAMIIDVPKDTPNEIIVGLNDRNPQLHDVYRLNLTTGERTLIRKNEENIAGWATDLKGNLRLGIRQTSDGGTEILSLDGDKLTSIYSVSSVESASPLRFLPDGKSFYLITNKGKSIDKTELQMFDLETGKTKSIERDPKNEVDFGGAIFSDLTNELQATYYVGDRVRIYPRQEQFSKDYDTMKKALPEGELSLVSVTNDENTWLVSVSRDVDPGSIYVFDRTTGKAELLYRSRPNLPSENLAPMKPVRYKTRDGMTVPAYLILPMGILARNLPTVMFIHGGPWGRDSWGYNSIAQFLANRGYAVLMPNFRGSAGYGKKFLNAGNKEWGTGSMQHDITDGVRYLIREGIADPKKVAICGGSYGGYATLAGLAFTPDIYAAGFDIVGPSNIITLLNSIPPYWAPIKKIFSVRVGDLENPKDVEMLKKQSPLNSATKITAPLFVVQGANDPRVNKAESDQIVVALRDLGRQVEYMVAPDEGHGFAGKENRLAMFTAMEQFFAKHLKGRVQESVSPVVQKKLGSITVDISSVTLPKREIVEASPSAMSQFDGTKLKPMTSTFSTKLSMMGQELNLSSTRTVAMSMYDGKPIWRVVEQASGPMGSIDDTTDLDAKTLLPVRRAASQGGGTLLLVFTSESVSGKIAGGGMDMPVNIKTDNPVLSDGAGSELAISTLPLAEGYKASLSAVDIMKGSAKEMSLYVSGVETITVQAGTFSTYKVEISSGDESGTRMTIWFSREDRRMVKVETKLPAQMGGGMSTTELAK